MQARQVHHLVALVVATVLAAPGGTADADSPLGYYRQPDLHGDTIVFVAEGDVWRVSAAGGVARRLTTHPSEETGPAISPDGRTVAFVGRYEGPTEVYTIPLDGGLPTRRTYGTETARYVGWTPGGEVLYATDVYATLPNYELVRLDVSSPEVASRPTRVPLAQAANGTYEPTGRTLFFTRLPFQGSHTKRYQGGTAQNIWRFTTGDAEAVALTADFPGTSKRPMWWNGRVYFASDRDETMNLWSMDENGGDLQQHTQHVGWDVRGPRLQAGRIVYQLGADLHVYDIDADRDRTVEIRLASDFDQMREHWIDEPMDFLVAAHPSPNGDRVALTARGRVFVAPHRQGRLVAATPVEGVRYRGARFMPDGASLLALSDASGEVEAWTLPANGVGAPSQHTRDATVLRWDAVPSPDGTRFAHHDKDQRLFVHDIETGADTLVEQSPIADVADLAWSPSGRWLAYVVTGDNLLRRIRLYDVRNETIVDATTDRFESFSPTWSADGGWLYFLSDRSLRTSVASPWGSYGPQPFLDNRTQVFQLALRAGMRSPFAPADELMPGKDESKDEDEDEDEGEDEGEGKGEGEG
ncbi:MAG: S41 family peptidase, partial [Planctomycetota bacterium]